MKMDTDFKQNTASHKSIFTWNTKCIHLVDQYSITFLLFWCSDVKFISLAGVISSTDFSFEKVPLCVCDCLIQTKETQPTTRLLP